MNLTDFSLALAKGLEAAADTHGLPSLQFTLTPYWSACTGLTWWIATNL
jgi:hypothetical protein